MVSQQSVHKQLKKIDFNPHGWNRSEVAELHNILLPDEEIYECVNGIYEGGFALLIASDVRVLLVDKKPLSFLNVEDLRFDMINEIDYNHRMVGSSITVTTGSKTLNFRSYNKDRLRKLIGHVQHCMAANKNKESTHAEGQNQHLEQINQQLQAYLVAQHQQQQQLQEHLEKLQSGGANKATEPLPKVETEMSTQLKDYLFASELMKKFRHNHPPAEVKTEPVPEPEPVLQAAATHAGGGPDNQLAEIYADGIQEVFGKRDQNNRTAAGSDHKMAAVLDINPLKVARNTLLALRSRKFGLSMPTLPSPFPLGRPSHPTLKR